jgi:uncharacterized protein (DUF1786 family)
MAFYNVDFIPEINIFFVVINSRTIISAEYMTCRRKTANAYIILVGSFMGGGGEACEA